ncbi:MAG: hypothetical protein WBV46_20160 [Terriglobales bacterium]
MSARKLIFPLLFATFGAIVLCYALPGSILLFAQSKPATPDAGVSGSAASSSASPISASVQEFPVTMRQNVVAGKTPAGTKIEARLMIATLVKGAVIPEGAIFSGEIVDSRAKSATDPSRLIVRMDTVQWKKESRPIKVFLTAWYYPILMGQDAEVNNRDRPLMGNGGYSTAGGTRTSTSTIGPSTPPDALPPPPGHVSENRVAMKDVESSVDAEGNVAITSTHANLKLDKSTTYVLATGDLPAEKADKSK